MGRIVVLTPNPAIDVTYFVASTTIGQTHRVSELAKRAGGKGINVARVLKMLGHEPICVLPLGGAPGSWIRSELESAGVASAVSRVAADTRTTVAIVDGSHHPTLFAEPGPEMGVREVHRLARVLSTELQTATCLVIAGSLPPSMFPADVTGWIGAARRAGVPVIVDAGGEALVAAATAGANLVKANEDELREATSAGAAEGMARLRSMGARAIVVSKGSRGLEATDDHGHYVVAAIEGIDGNPTGAGDAATAGLAAAIVEGLPLQEGLWRAAALGAAAVLSPVAGEVRREAYLEFLSRFHLRNGSHG